MDEIKSSEQAVLGEICKHARMGIDSINTVIGKVYDDELSLDLNKQAARYSQLEEKAVERIKECGNPKPEIPTLDKARLWASLQAGTLLNTSTENVAEMIIQSNASGIVGTMRSLKSHPTASKESCELAEELMDFEVENIEKLKGYRKK